MTTTLLTGLPRSGTSFVCACLNTLPDAVALVEPMDVPRHGDRARAVGEVLAFAEATRHGLLTGGRARSATVAGVIPDNTFGEAAAGGGLRRSQIAVTDVSVAKPLTPDFRLFIKHPALFTALAGPLRERLPLFAVVRYPLAALASWATVDMAIHHGRWPVAEAFASDLKAVLDAESETLPRRIALMRWIFREYGKLPAGSVVTYEAIVADPASALRPLCGPGASPSHPVRASEPGQRYPGVDLARLATALRSLEEDVAPFYPDFAASLRDHGGRG